MCPFCVSGAIWVVGSVLSTGGLTALAAKRASVFFGSKRSSRKANLKESLKGGNDASHRNAK
jgi:hypothetical protein